MKSYDIIIVGAGLSGSVLARMYAEKRYKVLVIDKRNNIGGNCYDYYNEKGVLVSKYGAHIFHTNDEIVWDFVNRFGEWKYYIHKVLSYVDNKLVNVPVNINTVNSVLGLNLKDEKEILEWLKVNTENIPNPKNSEESSLNRVGKVLYEKMFKNYTIKQWDTHPKNLSPDIMNRIPVRCDFNNNYFTDKYQAVPSKGYTEFFKSLLNHSNIEIKLATDWDNINDEYKYDKLFFTGRIDSYFNHKFGELQYRSLDIKFETYNQEYYQSNSVINYPSLDFDFTRIVEYKHLTAQKINCTTISKEYPTWKGEPYYPVDTEQNRKIYKKYQDKALELEKDNIYFVGRLANYKYFDMDKAIKNALDLFHRLEKN